MQLEPDLTLKEANDLAHQCKSVKKQQPTVRDQDTKQGAIRNKHGRQQSKNSFLPFINLTVNHIHNSTRCGQSPKHYKRSCHAKDSICHGFHKKENFKVV